MEPATKKLQTLCETLKSLRKEAGISQAALGERIGLSRETIIAIEKLHPGSVDTLEFNIVRKWYLACLAKASSETIEKFKHNVKDAVAIA